MLMREHLITSDEITLDKHTFHLLFFIIPVTEESINKDFIDLITELMSDQCSLSVFIKYRHYYIF